LTAVPRVKVKRGVVSRLVAKIMGEREGRKKYLGTGEISSLKNRDFRQERSKVAKEARATQ